MDEQELPDSIIPINPPEPAVEDAPAASAGLPFDEAKAVLLRFPGRAEEVTAEVVECAVVIYRDGQGRELYVETYSPTVHA